LFAVIGTNLSEDTVTKCQKCGRDNSATAKLCVYCGNPLVDLTKESVTTKALDNVDFEENIPKWGSSRSNSRVSFVITEGGQEQTLTFETVNAQEIIIGRRDPQTQEEPTIDLTSFDALNKGVSRRHASIIRKDGSLHIIDKGSPNGTFLNGQRLVQNQPRVVRNGDDIRFGHLTVRVSFEQN
jgi:pSer/pThr/pTyr-binding forkhead associated (FHA) protein